MSLAIDCLVAAGTFTVAFGSGMQAYSELITLPAMLRRLGLGELVGLAFQVYRAATRLTEDPPWRVPANLGTLFESLGRYRRAAKEVGATKLTRTQLHQARVLAWKSAFWALIMLGSLVLFVAAMFMILGDVRTA